MSECRKCHGYGHVPEWVLASDPGPIGEAPCPECRPAESAAHLEAAKRLAASARPSKPKAEQVKPPTETLENKLKRSVAECLDEISQAQRDERWRLFKFMIDAGSLPPLPDRYHFYAVINNEIRLLGGNFGYCFDECDHPVFKPIPLPPRDLDYI